MQTIRAPLPGSRCVKVPMTKSSVETASTASSSSWSRTIHLTPARLIPSSASSTATDMPRTAHWLCRPSTSATDSEKPVMYMAPATHCKAGGSTSGDSIGKCKGCITNKKTSKTLKSTWKFVTHLPKHIQEAHSAPHPATQDGGDHGVDSSAPDTTVLTHADARHHRH